MKNTALSKSDYINAVVNKGRPLDALPPSSFPYLTRTDHLKTKQGLEAWYNVAVHANLSRWELISLIKAVDARV